MAKRGKARPTDAELAILRVLWRLGPSTVRQVQEALERVAADRLHDGAEAASDHGGEGTGRSRRVAAVARLSGAVGRG